MSHWRCLLKDMADAGGERLQASALPGWGITRATQAARAALRQHGLIKPVGARCHSITPKGWRVVAGVADLVEPRFPGKVGHLPRVYSLVVRGPAVPDVVIEDLLIDAGLAPGQPISADIIRAFSARLAAVVRVSA